MYRIAGLGATYQLEGQSQSGVSKLVELEDFVIIANNLVDTLEFAENYLLNLMHIADGQDFIPTVYSRDFLETNYSQEVQRLRDVLELLQPEDPRREDLVSMFLSKHFELK